MSALFQPIKLGHLQLKNRVIVSPMCQYSAQEGSAQPWHHVHLGQFAMASAGMLILEATAVEAIGRITPGCLGLYSDDNERALGDTLRVMKDVVRNYRTPVCIQLAHAGRKASSQSPWEGGQQIPASGGGWEAVAPSPLPHLQHEVAPRDLTLKEIKQVIQAFVQSAERANRLGIDAIELHAAHGYLLHQFLSPLANQRTDEYGGSLQNRMRLPLEIYHAVRKVWPKEKPIGLRLSASDWDAKSSWDLTEAVRFAKECEKCGMDWIDVSSGGVSSAQKIQLGPGYQVHFAEAIKQVVSTPVMAVGLITEPSQAESIVADGQADMVALARAFLYNPRWVWHAAAELGAQVAAPPQYWRSEPHSVKGLFGETSLGMR
ncbi:MAG: NADH:flavin oxidoreductase/NADH oxidase [Acidiferrobacterales bacterium]|nr:NADH:flavin oxidoreductase/NADH oxidase [Acidiferrobacterales bacterium]